MKDKLELAMKPVFTQKFSETIWRILPDVFSNNLLIEARNANALKVHFYIVNLNSLKVEEIKHPFSQKWWMGVEIFQNNKILFHQYYHQQFSNHVGIFCFDILTNKMLWEHKNLVFKELRNNTVFASYFKDPLKLSCVEMDSGNETTINVFSQTNKQEQWVIPYFFDEEDPNFSKVFSFISKTLDCHAVKGIEYLDYEDKIFISFYTFETNQYTNHFIVCDLAGNILLKSVLDKKLKGVGSGTFLVFKNNLITVYEKNNLLVYEI